MRKSIFLTGLLLVVLVASAQRVTRAQFDSMARTIEPGRKDTQQMFTFLRMAEFQIHKPGEVKKDLDSARDCIEKARAINSVVKSRVTYAYLLYEESMLNKENHGPSDSTRSQARQAVAILQTCNNPLLLGKALSELSTYGDFEKTADMRVKIDLLQKALACFNQTPEVQMQGYCCEQLADLFLNQPDNENARKYALMAVERYKQSGYPNSQRPYILIASTYMHASDYGNAMKYSLLSLDALKRTHDTTAQLCEINNRIGILYARMDEWEKGVPYWQEALQWARTHNDLSDLYIVESNLQWAYAKSGWVKRAVALADSITGAYGIPKDTSMAINFLKCNIWAYCNDHQFDKARKSYDRLKPLSSQDFSLRFSRVAAMMDFDHYTGQKDEAIALVPQLKQLMKESPDSNRVAEAYRLLFTVDSDRHDFRQAVLDLSSYDRLKDSITNMKKTKLIQQLQIDYATAEKEHSISLLQKESELQKKDIASTRQTRNYSIVVAVLLLAVGFGRYRLKQRQNRQLAARQGEISAKNEQLEKLLRENEWLLREVHHRVKNNLQIVTSLLGTQSARLRDEAAFNAVSESQHRVHSMALIHQKLYKSDNLSSVNMEDYVGDLVEYLRDSISPGQAIAFEVYVEPLMLDVAQAVPLGLVLNEVITNSIKYAFPDGRSGLISIRFSSLSDGRLSLRISDDGIGLPSDMDPLYSTGFGLRLIRGLAGDLEAEIEMPEGIGTTWIFIFAKDPAARLGLESSKMDALMS